MSMRIDRLSTSVRIAVLLVVELLAPIGVAGQDTVVPFQLSFSDPGARNMGSGGAFVALADDAIAALANPAGLVQLVRPEVSVEGRHWSYSTPFTVGGRVEGLPSGIGIDTEVGLRTASSEEDITGVSFLSFVSTDRGQSPSSRPRLRRESRSGGRPGRFCRHRVGVGDLQLLAANRLREIPLRSFLRSIIGFRALAGACRRRPTRSTMPG